MHYCGGNLASIGFLGGKAKSCCETKNKPSDCCKDKVKIFKSDEKQRTSQSLRFSHPLVYVIVANPLHFATNLAKQPSILATLQEYSPPEQIPIYLRDKVFRI